MYKMLRFILLFSLVFVLPNNIKLVKMNTYSVKVLLFQYITETNISTPELGNCIDCYDCNSDDSHCGEVPDGDLLILEGNVASGCPSCVKEFKALGTTWSRVTRRCGTSSETTDSCSDILGYGKCVCTTTFCNHGNSIHVSKAVLMCAVALLSLCL